MKVNVFYRHVGCRNIKQRRKGRTFQHGPFLPNQGQRLIDNNGVGFGRLCIDSGCKMDDVSGTGLRHRFRQAGCTSGLHHDFIRPCRRAAQKQRQQEHQPCHFFHSVFLSRRLVQKVKSRGKHVDGLSPACRFFGCHSTLTLRLQPLKGCQKHWAFYLMGWSQLTQRTSGGPTGWDWC